MLQQSTNPPQFSSAGLSATKPLATPFDVINAEIMPIETDSGNDLLDALCYMKAEADVVGMVELFEAYMASRKINGCRR